MKLHVARTAAAIGFSFSAGCGMHAVEHSAPNESLPHYSWEIRSGRLSADDNLVCEGGQATPSCVLEAGTPVTVHLAFHSVKEHVTYNGQMTIPFVEGVGGGGVRQVSADVRPGTPPINTSVTGEVLRKPGTYAFVISVTAQQGGRPGTPISSDVKVTVR